ncbi:MAG: hypothetical protein NTV22_17480 [bacterium]|nr:hypothetical protein [bacterium]
MQTAHQTIVMSMRKSPTRKLTDAAEKSIIKALMSYGKESALAHCESAAQLIAQAKSSDPSDQFIGLAQESLAETLPHRSANILVSLASTILKAGCKEATAPLDVELATMAVDLYERAASLYKHTNIDAVISDAKMQLNKLQQSSHKMSG